MLLEERYPGDLLKFDQYYSHKYDVQGHRYKVAGYTYGGLSVYPTLDTEGYTLKDMCYVSLYLSGISYSHEYLAPSFLRFTLISLLISLTVC